MDFIPAMNSMLKEINSKIDHEINIDQILGSELSNIIDYNLWIETIELQKKFNDSVAPDWIEDIQNQKYDNRMAIFDETEELLNSRHWKWWKNSNNKNKVDWENVKVELTDLFLFILSICIQRGSTEVIFAQLINLEMNKDKMTKIRDEKFFDEFWDKFLMPVQMKSLPMLSITWADFWYRSGGTAEELFMGYRIKAALNNIRQEFGYGAKNSYIKMWVDDQGQRVEDNVMAWKLAEGVELNKDTINNITKKLRDYYLSHVAL
jgi:hypothetical protein